MSESEATPTVRRSNRERKIAKPFAQVSTAASKKRKRDTDNEAGDVTDKLTSDGGEVAEEPNEDPDDDDEDEEDYSAPKTKATKMKRQPVAGASKTKTQTPVVKKPRAVKPKVATGTRKTKVDATVDVVQQIRDSHISDDNALFNTILNPSAALQSTVEDYLDALSNTPDLALADLTNCILRACGCNDSVDSHEATDQDGVVDKLDTFTEGLKQANAPLYPLASKLPIFKKFRKQLSEFLHRLVASSAELGSLYTSDLLPTVLPWVVAMSSSQLRSLRHTATVVAMDLESALCEVAAEVEKEVVIIARQREGEKKRAGTSKSKGKGRDKEFENKAQEVRQRKTTLKAFIDDFFNGVFVHRYRDHDPGIRTECVQAMGVWFKSHPSQFLDGRYFHYVGWVLSDADTHVRLAAVKSLQALYASPEHLGTLQQFTDRFKGRLVQMATSDLELSVRVAALQVLSAIDGHSLLEEEQRDELCLLVYDEEPRVRQAVAGFVKGVWDEAVEDGMIGRNSTGGVKEKETERVGIKCLATLLVKWAKRTRQGSLQLSEDDNDDESPAEENESKNRDIARLVSAQQKGRIALAVEALWEDVPAIADWEALLEHLLLDHSASDVGTSPMRAGKKSKKAVEVEVVDEAWRLSEPEEAALLECFVAVLRRIKEEAGPGSGGKKGEAETAVSDMTRALIKGLPRLFAKHQTDPNRVADVLVMPQLMNLDMYLEMRMIPAYENLWDDIIKQFTSHSSPITLSQATSAIQHLTSTTLLANTNTSKNTELEEELSTSLRDAIAGREELDVAGFSEDEVHTLGTIAARLVLLSGVRDMTGWMEEDEGGKQSSAWDIMNVLAGRGRLGYKEEEAMIEECLRLLILHLAWKSRGLSNDEEPSEEAVKYKEFLEEQRNSVLEKVTEFAVGSDSKPCEGVKRAAFHSLINLHILFCHGEDTPPSALPLSMDDETQYRCAGFVQAEVEQFVDELEENEERERGQTTEEETSRAGSTSEGEGDADANANKKEETPGKKQRKGRPRKDDREDSPDPRSMPQSHLEREYVLNALLATFIRAIRVGVLNPSHSAVVLAHYDRLGSGFDTNIKVVIDFLRDVGMFKGEGQVVSEIIVRAIQESFTMFMDDIVHIDDHAVALARALSACFIVRGAQLSVVKRLESEHVVDVQTRSISWIVKLLAGYVTLSNKKMTNKALLFFRVLQQLSASIESRDALKIKAHLDQAVAQSKLQIGTTKAWDPYRAYEKRLGVAMSKDKTIPTVKGKKRTKKGTRSGEMIHSDEDETAQAEGLVAESGTEAEADAVVPPPRLKSKPKPRPKARRQRLSEGNDGDDEDVFGPVASPAVQLRSPSKRRAAQKAAIRDDIPAMNDDEEPVVAQQYDEEPATNGDRGPAQNGKQPITNGHQPPAVAPTSRKRRRQASETAESDGQENIDPAADQAPSPARSHVSVADIKNRRKRVRR
ncbi:hypothetical protein BU17DRAFT_95252 [Hysterangium stoloniferum]|nr:hypothetical protein BU17DRAFT_95252 [Hysterangium stoloniferum]